MVKIHITYGTGRGATEKSAFDGALWDAGIANYNLIQLSSVIPSDSEIIVDKINWNYREHGYKLYCVLAHLLVEEKGRDAWAGVGWVQDEKTGKGLFVEHHGYSEEEVNDLIEKSLKEMNKRRGNKFGELEKKVVGVKNEEGGVVCALVCAAFQTEGWDALS